MTVAAAQLLDNPTLLAQFKVEFEELTSDFTYTPTIPDGAESPKPHI
jgi:hypothetical protein